MQDKLTKQQEQIRESGELILDENKEKHKIFLLNIIGEIEGHECLASNLKTTKYEHVLPQLAQIEDSCEVDGLLILIHTVGGDVEAGLAIAEMLASISKPVVTLVLGGSHSIGVPLAVSGDVSFIVPTATMVVHPLRVSDTVLGVRQNYEYIERMQDRIIQFTSCHSKIDEDSLRSIMFNTQELSKDIGSVLVGKEAVKCGIIDRIGGVSDALNILYDLIN